ncbi:hypothetical protein [Streptomyces sp. NPDC005181]|uniref:hypothetical protein n=1 Tax=Streptomyces sp. NPDC005181 TaxID=3156869 RepID=UPI0033B2C1CD
MNHTALLTAIEKTAHTTLRRAKHPLPTALTTEDVARAAATPGLPVPPPPTALRTRITNGGLGPERGLPRTGGPNPHGQQAVVALLDGTGWYGDDPDDDTLEPQPWPDYNART